MNVLRKKATPDEVNRKPYRTGLCCRICENHIEPGDSYLVLSGADFVEDLWHRHDDIFCTYNCYSEFVNQLRCRDQMTKAKYKNHMTQGTMPKCGDK